MSQLVYQVSIPARLLDKKLGFTCVELDLYLNFVKFKNIMTRIAVVRRHLIALDFKWLFDNHSKVFSVAF